MKHLLALVIDLMPRRICCKFGCGDHYYSPLVMERHYYTHHAGDRMATSKGCVRNG